MQKPQHRSAHPSPSVEKGEPNPALNPRKTVQEITETLLQLEEHYPCLTIANYEGVMQASQEAREALARLDQAIQEY